MSGSLFEEDKPSGPPPDAPLADRLRPQTLDEVVGQGHLLDLSVIPGRIAGRAGSRAVRRSNI